MRSQPSGGRLPFMRRRNDIVAETRDARGNARGASRRARSLRVCARDATSHRARSCRVRGRRCAFAAQTGGSRGHLVDARSPSRGGARGSGAPEMGRKLRRAVSSRRDWTAGRVEVSGLEPFQTSRKTPVRTSDFEIEEIESPSLVSWRAQRSAWRTRRAEAFVGGVSEERVTSSRVRSPRRGRARASPRRENLHRRSRCSGRHSTTGVGWPTPPRRRPLA